MPKSMVVHLNDAYDPVYSKAFEDLTILILLNTQQVSKKEEKSIINNGTDTQFIMYNIYIFFIFTCIPSFFHSISVHTDLNKVPFKTQDLYFQFNKYEHQRIQPTENALYCISI